MISDKQSIAELFKNHFVRLAEGVTQLDTEDYCEDFRNHPSINAIHENGTGSVFKIQNTNSIQIKNLILGINTRKSCGYDIILPRLVKESADVIAQRLASIINYALCQSRWKLEKWGTSSHAGV